MSSTMLLVSSEVGSPAKVDVYAFANCGSVDISKTTQPWDLHSDKNPFSLYDMPAKH